MTKIKPRVIMKSADRMEFVFDKLCEYWNVSREDFLKRARTKDLYHKKRIAIKILRDEAELSLKQITSGFNQMGDESNIWEIHSRVSSDLYPHNYGNKELKEEYKKILQFMGI
jgi:chromosomal replication initiation ATPase DnaA